jgi:hypothetical protein
MEDMAGADAKKPRGLASRLFRTLFGSLVVSEIALLLRLCGDEGVSTLLRVLRRLFIVDEVMPEIVDWLFRGHVEDMGSAGIDDNLEIGFSDRLTVRSWCPVVFLANQDENANRWVDAVVAERIVGDDPCDPAVPAPPPARGCHGCGRC